MHFPTLPDRTSRIHIEPTESGGSARRIVYANANPVYANANPAKQKAVLRFSRHQQIAAFHMQHFHSPADQQHATHPTEHATHPTDQTGVGEFEHIQPLQL